MKESAREFLERKKVRVGKYPYCIGKGKDLELKYFSEVVVTIHEAIEALEILEKHLQELEME